MNAIERRTPEQPDALMLILQDPARLSALDTGKLKEMLEMSERIKAERARIEFHEAMNRVQSRMEPVRRMGYNQHTQSRYALAEDVEKMLMPIALEEGLSISGSTEPGHVADHLRFVLMVRHNAGHSERHALDAPIDTLGPKGAPTKTKLHGMGSTMTYCHRYLLCMVFSVQLSRDDDGNAGGNVGPSSEPITAEQAKTMLANGEAAGVDWDRFYDHFKVAALADLPRSRYAEATSLIAAKKARKA